MSKLISVDLKFKADTSQAKAEMEKLRQQLNGLSSGASLVPIGSKMTKHIYEATNAATDLRRQLEMATNVNTGKLDLGKFTYNLKKSGMSIKEYGDKLQKLGPEGVKAFQNVARAIASAEKPVLRVSSMVDRFGKSLVSVARYQISSKMFMGFTQGISAAYQYAQNLNKSLNDIRIVTKASTDEMADFAVAANKAAKALSASTLDYTKAALIYYQQGLDKNAVKERTDVTVKMANVTGKSAKEVSSQLTAIWNNFDNGSEKLEYYADVLAKLGATTASSTDEIATALEKFAAVADTVGLSYENASAAVSTVIAKTRQSADVVGTAFKTLFSRMEQLNQGEVLEDGTSLGQYSQALANVGVQIKTANGEMRTMDDIIDQTGQRWKTLSNDQQIALAQQVAGIRQYQQFIALMNNYDTYKENVNSAKLAAGELEDQNEIYAESWEAANKRVRASLESLYADMFNDEFFIKLTNAFGTIVDFIDRMVKGAGGFQTILISIGGILLSVFNKQIMASIDRMIENFKVLRYSGSSKANKDADKVKEEAMNKAVDMNGRTGSGYKSATIEDYSSKELQLRQKLAEKANLLTEADKERYQSNLNLLDTLEKEAEKYAEMHDKGQLQSNIAQSVLGVSLKEGVTEEQYTAARNNVQTSAKKVGEIRAAMAAQPGNLDGNYSQAQMKHWVKQGLVDKEALGWDEESQNYKANAEQVMGALIKSGGEATASLNNAKQALGKMVTPQAKKQIEEFANGEVKAAQGAELMGQKSKQADKVVEHMGDSLDKTVVKQKTLSETIVGAASSMSQLYFGVMSLSNGIKALGDDSLSSSEAMKQMFTGILMGLPMIIGGFMSLNKVLQASVVTAKVQAAVNRKAKEEGVMGAIAQFVAEKILNTEKLKGIALTLTVIALAAVLVVAIIAIVAAVKAIAKAISDWYNKDQIAAERAKKHAEETAKAYQTVKQAYDDLKKSIEDYHSAQDAIDKLKEGTKEWKQAIYEANLQVLDMLEKYPEMAKYVTNQNGRLTISEEDSYKLLEEQNTKVMGAYGAKQDAAIKAKELDLVSRRTNLSRDTLDTLSKGGAAAGALTGAATGAAIGGIVGSVVPVIGNAVVGGIGAILGAAYGVFKGIEGADEITNEQEREVLKQLENTDDAELIFAAESQTEFARKLEEAGINASDAMVKALWDNKDSVLELIESNHELAQLQEIANQQKIDNILYSQEGFDSSYYGAKQQEFARELMEKDQEALRAEYGFNKDGSFDNDKYANWSWFNWVHTDDSEKLFKEWLKLQGKDAAAISRIYENSDFHKTGVTAKDGDESIDKSFEEMSSDVMNAKLADNGKYYATVMNANANIIRKFSEDYSNNYAKNAFGSFLENDDLSGVGFDRNKLIELKGQIQGVTNNELASQLGITKKIAEQMGYDSAEALADAYREKLLETDVNEAYNDWILLQKQNLENIYKAGAQQLEVNASAFELYSHQLAKNTENAEANMEVTANMVVANYRLGKGVSGLRKVWEENADLLADNVNDSLDYYEALGKIKEQVEKTFGVKVSADFMSDNLERIRRLAEGDVKALKELKDEVIKDFVQNLSLDDNYKTALQDWLEDAKKTAEENPIGFKIELNDTNAIDAMNTALATGQTTVEELEALFANANIQMPKANMVAVPNLSESVSVSTWTSPEGKPMEVTTTTKNTTYTQVPYFGDNKPVFDIDESTKTAKVIGHVDVSSDTYKKASKEKGFNEVEWFNKNKDKVNVEALSEGTSLWAKGMGDDSSGITFYEDEDDKRKRQKNKKLLEDEMDRYHEIKEYLSDIQRQLDAISKAKDRAFGKAKLKLIDQEIKKTKENIKAQEEYVRQIKANLPKDQKKLNKWGFTTDESGRINNYEEIYKKQLDAYNSQVTRKLTDKQKDQLEKNWNDFKKSIEQYEETLNLLEDEQQNLIEMRYDLEDQRLEKITEKVKQVVDVAQDSLDLLDHKLKMIEDDAFAAAEAIGLIGKKANDYMTQSKASRQGIMDILGEQLNSKEIDKLLTGDTSVLKGKNFNQNQIDQIKEYLSNLMDYDEEMKQLAQEVQDQIVDAFENWNDQLERNVSLLEHNKEVASNLKNIIGLVGKDVLGVSNEMLQDMIQTNVDSAISIVNARKTIYDTDKQAYEEAKEAFNKGIITEETFQAIEDKFLESENNLLKAWQDALNQAKEAYEETVENILENFERSVSGVYASVETLSDMFKKQEDLRDFYLKDYEKTYETNKLNRDIMKSINNLGASDVRNSRRLRDLQEELLSYQQEGKKMSDYDLGYLQKKYALLQSQIALEESQNAKSTVRLSRDSQGNYGYVYTANQEQLDKAQSDYEQRLYDMEKYLDESTSSLSARLIQIYKEYEDAISNVEADAVDREKRIEEIREYYSTMIKSLTGELSDMMIYGKRLNEEYGTHAAAQFHDTVIGKMYTDVSTFKDLEEKANGALVISIGDINLAHDAFEENTDRVFKAAGSSVQDFKDQVADRYKEIKDQNNELVKSTQDMSKKIGQAFTDTIAAAARFQTNYNNNIQPLINKTEEFIEKVQKAITAYGQFSEVQGSYDGSSGSGSQGGSTGVGDISGNGTPPRGGDQESDVSPNSSVNTPKRFAVGTLTTNYGASVSSLSYIDSTKSSQKNSSDVLKDTIKNYTVVNGAVKYYGKMKVDEPTTSNEKYVHIFKDKQGNFMYYGASTDSTQQPYVDKGVVYLPSKFSLLNVPYLPKDGIDMANFLTGDTIKAKGSTQTFCPTDSSTFALNTGFANQVTDGKSITIKGVAFGKSLDNTHGEVNDWFYQIASGRWIKETDLYKLNGNKKKHEVNGWNIPSLDTGGYTGSWGPEGRMAMLHQKEIVLNAHDTENLLTVVDVVRNMVDKLEFNALATKMALSNRVSSANPKNGNAGINQNITIHAEFPDATDHKEIEQAFNNLLNQTAQYINR